MATPSNTVTTILNDMNSVAPDLLGTAIDPSLSNIMRENTNSLQVDPMALKGLGLMDSHKYRAKFLKIAKDKRTTTIVLFHIIGMAVAVKNKDRILSTINSVSNNPTITAIAKFYRESTRQYVPETANNEKLFPVVKIPESFPSLSIIWQILIHCDRTDKEQDDKKVANYKKVFETLFFCQFNLEGPVAGAHKDWEKDEFWGTSENTGKVQKSRFANRPKTVKLQFHEEYYNTKAADKYVLLNPDGSAYQDWDKDHEITEDEWKNYINHILDGVIYTNS